MFKHLGESERSIIYDGIAEILFLKFHSMVGIDNKLKEIAENVGNNPEDIVSYKIDKYEVLLLHYYLIECSCDISYMGIELPNEVDSKLNMLYSRYLTGVDANTHFYNNLCLGVEDSEIAYDWELMKSTIETILDMKMEWYCSDHILNAIKYNDDDYLELIEDFIDYDYLESYFESYCEYEDLDDGSREYYVGCDYLVLEIPAYVTEETKAKLAKVINSAIVSECALAEGSYQESYLKDGYWVLAYSPCCTFYMDKNFWMSVSEIKQLILADRK